MNRPGDIGEPDLPARPGDAAEPPPRSRRTFTRLAVLVLLAGACLVTAVATGASGLSVAEVVTILGGGGDAPGRTIVIELRMPRALLGMLVGGSLALAGAVFQALLRNPLAEPYVLGVSSGAAVGTVTAVVFGWTATSPWALSVAAFGGALLAIGLVLRIALSAEQALSSRVFVLAGVVVGAFFNAVILLLVSRADDQSFRSAMFWMMGSLAAADWREVHLLAVYLALTAGVLMLLARPLNLLAFGEETAIYLGVRVRWVKISVYLLTSLLVAAAVSASGTIGFVGLVVPHGLRLLWGSDHRLLLPASVLAGGSFLVLSDTVARTAFTPGELPTGVLTALVGVPVFVALLLRSRR